MTAKITEAQSNSNPDDWTSVLETSRSTAHRLRKGFGSVIEQVRSPALCAAGERANSEKVDRLDR